MINEYSPKRRLPLLGLDLSLQSRATMDGATVEEYAEAMRDGARFPPIRVRDIGTAERPHLIVTDGLHRVEAARLNRAKDICAEVFPCSKSTAYLDALGANTTHGLRRTNADKRHALELAWTHRREIWPRSDGADPSAEVLAKTCGVSLRMVKDFLSGTTTEQPTVEAQTQPVQIALVEPTAPVRQPVQIALVEPTAPVAPKMPRRVFGMDNKVRAVPPKMPKRPPAASAVATGFGSRANVPGHMVPVDRYGIEIPVDIGPVFTTEADREMRELLRKVSEARVTVKQGLDNRKPLFAVMRQDVLVQLDNAYRFIKAAQPHCVCRMCQGTGCQACHKRGWQTEDEYNRNPKEFKADATEAG